MFEKNQLLTAEVVDITAEGNGVCKVDNTVIFVPGTAVGDVIRLRIVKVLKSYCFGICDEIITPSSDRVDIDCEVSGKCGGCIFRHISYDAECKVKDNIVRSAFRRIGGLEPEFDDFMGCSETSRYRNKAQFPVAEADGKLVCGFYAPRSHRIVPVKDCRLQPEVFSEIVECVLKYLNEKRFSAYNEYDNTGIIRHIYLRRGAHSGEIMVCIVVRKDVSRQLMPLCCILQERFPDVVSVIMNINPEKTNVILGKKCVTLSGKSAIRDTMCGNMIDISPLAFYQVNTIQAECLYNKALEYASPSENDVIADLYCGAGTIGLSMAGCVSKVIGVEIIPEAVQNAKENAAINNISNAEFYCGDAGRIFSELRNQGCAPDIIVVDPPRKGCSQESLSNIAEALPDKIVMISCNPATAARDAKWLTEHGFSVEKVCGVDLFPRTGHVECVVLMSRDKA